MNILDFAPLVHKHTHGKAEDLRGEAWLAVVEAFADYDAAKGVPLPGYVESRVKYAVWNASKKEQRYLDRIKVINCLESEPSHMDVAEFVVLQLLRERLCKALFKLSNNQRQAIVKTIVLGYSLTDYARELGVTPQAVFNSRKRGLSSLKKMLA